MSLILFEPKIELELSSFTSQVDLQQASKGSQLKLFKQTNQAQMVWLYSQGRLNLKF